LPAFLQYIAVWQARKLALPGVHCFWASHERREKFLRKSTATCQLADSVRQQQPDRLLYIVRFHYFWASHKRHEELLKLEPLSITLEIPQHTICARASILFPIHLHSMAW